MLFGKGGGLRYQGEGEPVLNIGLQETEHRQRGVRQW